MLSTCKIKQTKCFGNKNVKCDEKVALQIFFSFRHIICLKSKETANKGFREVEAILIFFLSVYGMFLYCNNLLDRQLKGN